MGKRIIGHRGARDLWTENSLHGFRNTLALGLAGVEFDVHPTTDGDLAVIHDPTLDRTTEATGPVATRTMAELRSVRLRGAAEGVPSLDDVLDVFEETTTELHIELKADAAQAPYPGLEAQVVAHVHRRGIAAQTVLTSFWLDVLARLRAAWPDGRLLASLNAGSVERQGGLAAVLDRLDALRVEYVAVHKDLLAQEMALFASRVGQARLGVWVINAPEEAARWQDAPVSLITTDRPDRFLPVKLSRAALPWLRQSVRVPRFDPAHVAAGIVHLGLGGFHRAHMARYTHALMDADPAALAWGIFGAGLRPADRRMRQCLAPQDNLYSLIERDSGGEAVSVIACLAGVIFAGDGSAALLDAIDQPGIRIVSLTVTENGYCLDRATKRLDPGHALIRADLANPGTLRSAIGVIVEALRRRRAAGAPAFTALSCNNIQHNGTVLRDAVLTLAALRDPALADWIAAHGAFPSTMVDRITPVTTVSDIAGLAERHGLDDRWPVVSERFTQWVIEDRFVEGRPDWERVGAQMVDDVAPYEAMKLRLLNGSHLAAAGLGRLAGYATIDEAMADRLIARYMAALMDRETGPTLAPVPGIDLDRYKASLLQRFANATIRDTVDRVNADAPLNVLLDPIRDRLHAGQGIDLLALALAAWLRRVRGEDEAGAPLEVRHLLAAPLREKAMEGGEDPAPLLGIAELFGELGRDARLAAAVRPWLAMLHRRGSRAALQAVDGGQPL
jgi:fructuronate reductase/mannitol 2-dehydrogenase